jgi:hypothetical protein
MLIWTSKNLLVERSEQQIIKNGGEVVGVHQFNRIPQSLRIIDL